MKKKIIFIESSYTGAGEEMIKASLSLDIQPILMVKTISPYSFIQSYPELEVVIIDTDNVSIMADFISSNFLSSEIAITTTDDYSVCKVSELQLKFSLVGNHPDDLIVCRDKSKLRQKLEKKFKKNSVYFKTINPNSPIRVNTAGFSFPVILKPASYTGSIGVKLCHDEKDIYDHLQDFSSYSPPGSVSQATTWLIEEYILGKEYSGELLNGKCIGITKKFKTKSPYFVEIGHIFPAPLEEIEYKEISKKLEEIVDFLKLKLGPLHIEFFIDKNNTVRIVEINGRIPGDRIPILIKNALDFDVFTAHVKSLFGEEPVYLHNRKQHSAIRFKTYKDNKLFEDLSNHKEELFILQYIDSNLESCKSNLDRSGFAIFNSQSTNEIILKLGLIEYA